MRIQRNVDFIIEFMSRVFFFFFFFLIIYFITLKATLSILPTHLTIHSTSYFLYFHTTKVIRIKILHEIDERVRGSDCMLSIRIIRSYFLI